MPAPLPRREPLRPADQRRNIVVLHVPLPGIDEADGEVVRGGAHHKRSTNTRSNRRKRYAATRNRPTVQPTIHGIVAVHPGSPPTMAARKSKITPVTGLISMTV